jgi:hypothetical protein
MDTTAGFTATHHPRPIADTSRIGEGAAVFTDALGLVEGGELVGEARDDFLEEVEFRPAVCGGAEAVEEDFPGFGMLVGGFNFGRKSRRGGRSGVWNGCSTYWLGRARTRPILGLGTCLCWAGGYVC